MYNRHAERTGDSLADQEQKHNVIDNAIRNNFEGMAESQKLAYQIFKRAFLII